MSKLPTLEHAQNCYMALLGIIKLINKCPDHEYSSKLREFKPFIVSFLKVHDQELYNKFNSDTASFGNWAVGYFLIFRDDYLSPSAEIMVQYFKGFFSTLLNTLSNGGIVEDIANFTRAITRLEKNVGKPRGNKSDAGYDLYATVYNFYSSVRQLGIKNREVIWFCDAVFSAVNSMSDSTTVLTTADQKTILLVTKSIQDHFKDEILPLIMLSLTVPTGQSQTISILGDVENSMIALGSNISQNYQKLKSDNTTKEDKKL